MFVQDRIPNLTETFRETIFFNNSVDFSSIILSLLLVKYYAHHHIQRSIHSRWSGLCSKHTLHIYVRIISLPYRLQRTYACLRRAVQASFSQTSNPRQALSNSVNNLYICDCLDIFWENKNTIKIWTNIQQCGRSSVRPGRTSKIILIFVILSSQPGFEPGRAVKILSPFDRAGVASATLRHGEPGNFYVWIQLKNSFFFFFYFQKYIF